MQTFRSLLKAGVIAVAATASFAASATVLNTKGLEANATMAFSTSAMQALTLVNIGVTAGGYATKTSASTFNLPITSLDFTLGLKPLLTVNSGQSVGSSLIFTNSAGQTLTMSNFTLDFKQNKVFADLVSPVDNKKQYDIFNFTVTKPLTFNLTGGISIDETVGNLRLTDDAIFAFEDGLNVDPGLETTVRNTDFGTIASKVVPWFRKTPLSTTHAAAVPEPSTYALLGLGMIVAGAVARRRQAA